jgi:hypothetical protein
VIKIEIPKKEPIDGIIDITISEPINKNRSVWLYIGTMNVRTGPIVTIMQRDKINSQEGLDHKVRSLPKAPTTGTKSKQSKRRGAKFLMKAISK